MSYRIKLTNLGLSIKACFFVIFISSASFAQEGEVSVEYHFPEGDPVARTVYRDSDIVGVSELDEGIDNLDNTIREEASALSASQLEAVTELRMAAEHALDEEVRHLENVAYFAGPKKISGGTSKYISGLLDAAEDIMNGKDSVITQITAFPQTADIEYLSLTNYESISPQSQVWLQYSYGSSLPIRTYVFRLKKPNSRSWCIKNILVWDEPTTIQIGCN